MCAIFMLMDPMAAAATASKTGPIDCDDPSVTRPVNQTVISIKDSYPPLSNLLGEEGDVIATYTVNVNGTVSDVSLLQSSGLPRLDNATLNAARQLIYTPAKSGGTPVACLNHLRVAWRLSDDTAEEAAHRAALNYVIPAKTAWPPSALTNGKEGMTSVGLFLDRAGRILQTHLVRSSGTPELDDAAIAYVQKLKLKPAEINGNPASSAVVMLVIWSLQPPKLPHPAVATQ
jgi:protein TonB